MLKDSFYDGHPILMSASSSHATCYINEALKTKPGCIILTETKRPKLTSFLYIIVLKQFTDFYEKSYIYCAIEGNNYAAYSSFLQ
jgi:hypothetical protein